ncbi:MAG: Gfo/Idh/MocA family oxidoreductase [Pseudarcicella sp.]|nr:Gfo/Idh/MocA family oxidoreductase [Pseudarcicella sp.]MBP6410179.1 Gfo/Idh/MocA family oxidoreductase [Pseudarcicella sp.]
MTKKGVLIGTGYFSQFHIEAWQRIPEVNITAVCNRGIEKAKVFAQEWNVANYYSDFIDCLDSEKPDFVDIATPPDSHLMMVEEAAKRGIAIICQKPLAPTLEDSKRIVEIVTKYNVPFMVHENFRFQPWHREIKKILSQEILGKDIYSIYWRMRMGDGWQKDAYIARQPYFREYPQLLIYETGIHLIDTVRFLIGKDVTGVTSRLYKRNKDIKGEDAGVVLLDFENDTHVVLDMSRYNEIEAGNARYTFAEILSIDCSNGTIRLFADGKITIQVLGEAPTVHNYVHQEKGFAGDCLYECQKHFITELLGNKQFETNGEDYLKNLEIQNQIYSTNTR